VDGRVLWAGSDDGYVHVTRDGGQNWEKVTPPDLPDFTRISFIEASPHDAGTAYFAGNRYQRSDRSPYVYRTADYGKTWTRIVRGLPFTDFARTIREDKKRKGLLFLGSENGIYVSFDDGAVWQSLRLELPVTPVHGIEVKGDDVVIATHGRSFYVMNDISVLRQVTSTTSNEPVVLFRPAGATRSVSRGVSIDYFLKTAANAITIEILDAGGTVIRKFTGPAPEKSESPPPGEGSDDGGRPPTPRAPGKQGMNRFTWDMRYAGAREFPGLIMWAGSARGPLAPPGKYSARLTTSGVTKTEAFAITRNDAVKTITDADLLEQFKLAKQINDRVNAANEAVLRIRNVKDQVNARVTKTNDGAIKAAADPLVEKLTSIEGEIYQYRNRSNQDPLNYPIRLNNKLAALQGLVETGDFKPTDQSYAVFKDLSARLDKQFGELDTVFSIDLANFNKLLQRKKLEPVKDTVPVETDGK
jgi:hypothetical protein